MQSILLSLDGYLDQENIPLSQNKVATLPNIAGHLKTCMFQGVGREQASEELSSMLLLFCRQNSHNQCM